MTLRPIRLVMVLILTFLTGCSIAETTETAAIQPTTTTVTQPTTSTTQPPTTTVTQPPTTTVAQPTTTTVTQATTSTTQPPATTVTQPPTTTSAPMCPGTGVGPIPDGVDVTSMVSGDMDGDGSLDSISAYQSGDTWFLHAGLGSGYTTNLALDAAWSKEYKSTATGPVYVFNLVKLGSTAEIGVVLLRTRLVAEYGLFALEDCRVVALALPDGTLPELWGTGSPAHSDTPLCGPDNLVRQAIFGAPTAECDIYTCDSLNFHTWSYEVQRHPAGLRSSGEAKETITRDQMEELRGLACDDPATP